MKQEIFVQPAFAFPRPLNIIIELGPFMTRDISSQHILAGKRHFSGRNMRTLSGRTQLTSFLRMDETIESATYFGVNMGRIRGLTPLNIPVPM